MSTTKQYHLTDVLSVTTGRLVSTRHMDGVYDIMGYVLSDPGITTIGLAMMAETVRAAVLAQHPQLAVINDEIAAAKVAGTLPDSPEAWTAWKARQIERFGEWLSVAPMNDSPGAPSLDAQVAHVLSANPNAQIVGVEVP